MSTKEKPVTITVIETSLASALEKKKLELTATKGGVTAVKEVLKQHKEFLENSKVELKNLVSNNNLKQEVAQYVLVWLSKTSKHIEDYLDVVKSSRDIKTGEILTLDNVMKETLKLALDAHASSQQLNVVTPVVDVVSETLTQPKFSDFIPSDNDVETKRKSKKRPDQIGKLGETVERIKKAKRSKP